jgi:NAD(P)-dependent dehydrogenase (short-subunit alcohol dehydrogenase family)
MRVVVTGADRGVGLEVVRQLLARGDTVEAACRRPGEAMELRATGARIHGVDVVNGASVTAFAHGLDGAAIDLVINNAGLYGDPRQRLHALDYEAAMRTFEANALGVLRVSQAFVPHLRRGTGKKLAHLSSNLASVGATTRPGDLAHRMFRTALNMISKSIAAELHDDHIISIVVHPGWVRTDMRGPNAPITPAESARGILIQIDAAGFVDSGAFLEFRGERCAW